MIKQNETADALAETRVWVAADLIESKLSKYEERLKPHVDEISALSVKLWDVQEKSGVKVELYYDDWGFGVSGCEPHPPRGHVIEELREICKESDGKVLLDPAALKFLRLVDEFDLEAYKRRISKLTEVYEGVVKGQELREQRVSRQEYWRRSNDDYKAPANPIEQVNDKPLSAISRVGVFLVLVGLVFVVWFLIKKG